MVSTLLYTGLAFVIALGLYGLHRLCLWLESRGWLYYKKAKPISTLAGSLVALQRELEPQAQHVYELKKQNGRASSIRDEAMKDQAMPDGFHIREAEPGPGVVEQLADVLIDCVAGGASVSFVAPLSREKARAFWESSLQSAAQGERIILVAQDCATNRIVGTVQVILAMPENQPHRAEVAKMLVHRSARRRGLGTALMRSAVNTAQAAGKTLLVLDTATGGDAERLYARLGWKRCGTIPGYALLPQGGLCATTLFFLELDSDGKEKP